MVGDGIIVQYSVAFFNRYLKGTADALDSLTAKPLPPLVSFLRSEVE